IRRCASRLRRSAGLAACPRVRGHRVAPPRRPPSEAQEAGLPTSGVGLMGKPNKIRMRLVPAPWDEPSHQRAAITVEIDGRSLASIVLGASAGEASGEPLAPADVLWPGRELWLGHPRDKMSGLGVGDEQVAVLVCACGSFGCGGVGARIEV